MTTTQLIITICVICWMIIAAIITVARYQRKQLALYLLIEVSYLLEALANAQRTKQLTIHPDLTVEQALINIADNIDPDLGMGLLEHIEYRKYMKRMEAYDNDQS